MAGTSFLERSARSPATVASVGQYSTAEVAELVGLKATQVRHYVRRSLLSPLRGPRGEYRFSFQDVVMLRSAKELLDADVPVRRANRVLLDLKARNAEVSRPLSSLRVQAVGTRVVVQEGNSSWDAESGQGALPFMSAGTMAPDTAGSKVASLAILGSPTSTPSGGVAGSGSDRAAADARARAALALLAKKNREREAALRKAQQAQEAREAQEAKSDSDRPETQTGQQGGSESPQSDISKSHTPAVSTPTTNSPSSDTDLARSLSEEASEEAREEALAEALEAQQQGGPAEPTGHNNAVAADEIVVPEVGQLSSDDWYNLALDLEEADPDKAPQAYRQALEINPNNTDAQVNLGRLCQLRGNLKQARRHYKLALEIAPHHQLANYNMGTIYDELDEFETAREFYLRAVDIPDAHYNLARLFEVRGDELAALRHMREYRRLLEADITGR